MPFMNRVSWSGHVDLSLMSHDRNGWFTFLFVGVSSAGRRQYNPSGWRSFRTEPFIIRTAPKNTNSENTTVHQRWDDPQVRLWFTFDKLGNWTSSIYRWFSKNGKVASLVNQRMYPVNDYGWWFTRVCWLMRNLILLREAPFVDR